MSLLFQGSCWYLSQGCAEKLVLWGALVGRAQHSATGCGFRPWERALGTSRTFLYVSAGTPDSLCSPRSRHIYQQWRQCIMERLVHQENRNTLNANNVPRCHSGAIQYGEWEIKARDQTYSLGTYNWVVSINQENWLSIWEDVLEQKSETTLSQLSFILGVFPSCLSYLVLGKIFGLCNRKVSISLVEGPWYLASSFPLDSLTNEQEYLAGALDLELVSLSHQVSVSPYI